MEGQTVLLVLVPSVLSFIVAMSSLLLNYFKGKEQKKDEIWEATAQLLAIGKYPDEFAIMYEDLKAFKDNGYSANGINFKS